MSLGVTVALAQVIEAPADEGREIDGLSGRLNRQGRQERKDIAKGLLRIANKGIQTLK